MIIRQKYLLYVLALTSAIIAALVASIDTVISVRYITNPWAFGFSTFFVGIFITFLFALIFSIPIRRGKSLGSKLIDPSFQRLRLLKKEEIKYHVLAGIGNSILTIGYLSLLSLVKDPSVVLPFSQIAILYLVIIESITEKNIPTLVEIQSTVIVTFGAILGSISLSGTINLESLAIVFLVINPGWVLFSINQRKLKLLKIHDKPNDSINIRFWNVVFACIFTTIIVFLYDYILGTGNFIEGIAASIDHFDWMALTMGITFFSYVFYIRALGIGKASVTQAVRSTIIIFSIPFTILLAYFNIIPLFSTDLVLLLIKIIGSILILLGIVSFALTLVKAYVFISIKPGYDIEKTMNKLWDIRGVSRVTATAGQYDLIVKIHTRTLVKGYERTIRKIEEIDGIKDYKWESVLKEWEKI